MTAGSSSVSAQYPTGCTTCGAVRGQPCRSLRTRRVTDTHIARINAAHALRAPNQNGN